MTDLWVKPKPVEIDTGHGSFSILFGVRLDKIKRVPVHESPDTWRYEAHYTAPDSKTGVMTSWISNVVITNEVPPDHYPEVIRQLMVSIVEHEIDEAIRMDGVLIFDPHPTKPPRP